MAKATQRAANGGVPHRVVRATWISETGAESRADRTLTSIGHQPSHAGAMSVFWAVLATAVNLVVVQVRDTRPYRRYCLCSRLF